MNTCVVYSKGGDDFWGKYPEICWKWNGRKELAEKAFDQGMRYMYTGFRGEDKNVYVIVFDKVIRGEKEIIERITNGFSSIFRYEIIRNHKGEIELR